MLLFWGVEILEYVVLYINFYITTIGWGKTSINHHSSQPFLWLHQGNSPGWLHQDWSLRRVWRRAGEPEIWMEIGYIPKSGCFYWSFSENHVIILSLKSSGHGFLQWGKWWRFRATCIHMNMYIYIYIFKEGNRYTCVWVMQESNI